MGFEELGKKLMRLGQDTKSGVQKAGETYQINSKLADEKKKLEQLYRAIGEAVYAANVETPLEGLEDEFEAIKAVMESIADYTEQLNKKKGIAVCPECGREAAKGEAFCAECGAKLPEVEDDYSEKMKQDAKEAVNEAGEIMGDVMEKAKGFMGSMADKADAFVKGVASRVNNQNKDDVVVELEEHEVKTVDAEDAAEGSVEPQAAAQEGVAEAAEEILEEAEEVTEAVEETVEEVTEAAEDVEETAEEVSEAVKEAVEEAAETAGETVEEVLDAVEEAVEAAEEK